MKPKQIFAIALLIIPIIVSCDIFIPSLTSGSVFYNGNGATSGTIPIDENNPYKIGTLVAVKENSGNLTKAGSVFSGWNTRPDGVGSTYHPGETFTMPEVEVFNLYVKWSKTYTVTYDSNGATSGISPVDSNNPYVGGATVTVLGNTGNLIKDSDSFLGWNTKADGTGTTYNAGQTFTMPAASITLYAKWPHRSNVTYDPNGATSGNVPVDPNNPYLEGTTVTVLGNTGNLLKNSDSFLGWNTKADGTGTTYAAGQTFLMPTSSVTLYAKWPQKFAVTYNGNGATGGTAPVDLNGPYAQGVNVTVLGNTGNLVKTGHILAGWTHNAAGTGTVYTAGQTFPMPASAVTLYAKWANHIVSPAPTVTGQTSGETDETLTFTAVDVGCNIIGHALLYLFDWGDGSQSTWGPATASHDWEEAGSYQVRVKAKCSSDSSVITSFGPQLTVTIYVPDVTTTPNKPSINGSDPLHAGESYTFSTGGSTCNYHAQIYYRFDWGDGSSYSSWGSSSQSHTYADVTKSYYVKAQAKCGNGETSSWSSALNVNFIKHTVSKPGTPTYDGGLCYPFGGKEFNTTGSTCSWGHPVQYQYHWGNGLNSSWSTAKYSWANQDWTPTLNEEQTFNVSVTARCSNDTSIQSTSSSCTGVKVEDNYDFNPKNNSIDDATDFTGFDYSWLSDSLGTYGISWDVDYYEVLDFWNGYAFEVWCKFDGNIADIDIFLQNADGLILASSAKSYGNEEYILYPHTNLLNRHLYVKVITCGTYVGCPYDLRTNN